MSTVIDDYYELRLYRCQPGRIADLHHRMGYEIHPLFDRAGVVRPLAYWEGFSGPQTPLYAYMLRWTDLDARMAAFNRFYTDPDWLAQRDASNAGGQMVDQIDVFFLRPSPAWAKVRDAKATGPVGGVHELRLQEVFAPEAGMAHAALGEAELPFLKQCGATVLGAFAMWYGSRLPRVVTLLAWPNLATRDAALQAYDEDPGLADRRSAERKKLGQPLFGRCDTYLMRPAPYGTARANLAPLPRA